MSVEDRMGQLDKEVKEVNIKVENTLEVLGFINEKLKKLDVIERGLFGDEKLDYPGVIKTIASQEIKIKSLELKIEIIEKINREQDIAINAKKTTNSRWFDWGKIAIQTLIQLILYYLILKGVISADTALIVPDTKIP